MTIMRFTKVGKHGQKIFDSFRADYGKRAKDEIRVLDDDSPAHVFSCLPFKIGENSLGIAFGGRHPQVLRW